MRIFFLVVGLLGSLLLQAEPLKVATVNYYFKNNAITEGDAEFKLPFILANQAKIAQKINDYLFIDLLQTPAPANAKSGVVRHPNKDAYDALAGTTSLEYKVNVSNDKLLTITVSTEYCGAYCEEGQTSYSFDALSGRHIVLEDIFKLDSMEPLKNRLYQARMTTLKQTIKGLQQELAANRIKDKKSPEVSELEDKVTMYQTCLTEQAQLNKEPSYSDELGSFTLDAKGVTFAHGRCSNHASRALDEIDVFHNTLDYKALRPYFTDYAKVLLLNEKIAMDNTKPATTLGQVLYGTVGTSKIIMKLNSSRDVDGPMHGLYFYNKTLQPIELTGDEAADGIYWTEANTKSKQKPQIFTKQQGDALVGEWRGNDKVLPFKVAP